MLKAAIFDMDGLLIDTEPFWRQTHFELFDQHGVTITEEDMQAMQGVRTKDVVRHQRQKYGLEHIPNEILESAIFKRMIEHIREEGSTMEGVHKLLEDLQTRRLPIAIASSSPPEIIAAVLKKLDLVQYIDLTCSGVDERHGKPHPAVYLTTAKKLGVEPADCVVFEDSATGITAAKAAGMRCIAVPESESFNQPEVQAADIVLGSLNEVTWEMLNKLWD